MASKQIEGYRLSPQQARWWVQDVGGERRSIQAVYRVRGVVTPERLEAAWSDVARRHGILRTSFHRRPGFHSVLQSLDEEVRSPSVRRTDWRAVADSERAEKLDEFLRDARRRPWNWERPPLSRIDLIEVGGKEEDEGVERQLLVVTMPVPCADGRTFDNLGEELVRALAGELPSSDGDDPPVQYLEFSEWQHSMLKDPEAEEGLSWWRERQPSETLTRGLEVGGAGTEDGLGTVPVPTVSRPPEIGAGDEGDLWCAAWAALLFRLAGRGERGLLLNDIVDGCRYDDLAGVLGPGSRALPVAVAVAEQMRVSDLVEQVAARRREASEWQDFYVGPKEGVSTELGFEYRRSATREGGGIGLILDSLRGSLEPISLWLVCLDLGDRVSAELHYDRERYRRPDVVRWAAQLASLVESLAGDREVGSLLGEVVSAGAMEAVPVSEEVDTVVSQTASTESSANREALLRLLLEEDGVASGDLSRIPRRPAGAEVPLAFSQERLWVIEQLFPGTPVYNIPYELRLEGPVSYEALAAALGWIVRRHEVLRATVDPARGQPLLRIAPSSEVDPELSIVDTSRLGSGRSEAVTQLVRDGVGRPFDFERGPLLRALVVCTASAQHLLVLVFHHLIFDAWSRRILARELAQAYAAILGGSPVSLPELLLQYGDYAYWQSRRDPAELAADLAFWREHLEELPALELPLDRPRPVTPRHRGRRVFDRLEPKLAVAVEKLSRGEGRTLYSVLLAVFAALIQRWSGQSDFALGAPVAGRSRSELEPLVGCFINDMVLRVDLTGDPSWRELLSRVHGTVLEAQAHQEVPFQQLVRELRPDRRLGVNPFYQILTALEYQEEVSGGGLSGLDVGTSEVDDGTAKFDLQLDFIKKTTSEINVCLAYDTDLFDGTTARRLLALYRRLLVSALADPAARISQAELLDPGARHQLQLEWPVGAGCQEPVETLPWIFHRQASSTPDVVAVVAGDEHLSYGCLQARASRLGACLRTQGAGPDVVVGLHLERGVERVVSVLGVLWSGAAYLPLAYELPAERMRYQLEDAGARLVVARDLPPEALPTGSSMIDPRRIPDKEESGVGVPAFGEPSNAAYVMYTSGSTGRPKGVVLGHFQVVRLFSALARDFLVTTPNDVWTLSHSYAFDVSVCEIWGALLHGGQLVVVPWDVSRSPDEMSALLRRERVTVLSQTPSAFRQLARSPKSEAGYAALKWVIFGGENLPMSIVRPWLEQFPGRPYLVNLYGITEICVHASWRILQASDAVDQTEGRRVGSPVGRALADLELHVLDDRLRPVPIGSSGEIHVAGGGLARCYLGRPALTATRFVPHPTAHRPGERLYRSGDAARWLGDGDIEYVGRQDHQIKIRGFRIEPGEIEASLLALESVREAIVLARTDSEMARLHAFVLAAPGGSPKVEELRRSLSRTLPGYMVPSTFHVLGEFPLTPQGKVDRRALLALESQGRSQLESEYLAPRTPMEEILAEVWSEVLDVKEVGVRDNFFALGGDSIRSVRVVSLTKEHGLEFTVQDVFRQPDIESLARRLEEERGLDDLRVEDEDLDGLLEEVEGLSEEAVQARLREMLAVDGS